MTGTQKKALQADSPVEDAPKLPEREVEAEAQEKPKQLMALPPGVEISTEGDEFTVSVNFPSLPWADDIKVVEGQADPTLVSVPGLGAFRNGTKTVVSEEQVFLFMSHLQVTNVAPATTEEGK